MTISSNDPTSSSYTFHVTGAATAPTKPGLVVKQYYSYTNIYEVLLSNGQAVDFKDWRPDDAENSLCYYIENEGDADLRIDGASLSQSVDFKITDDVGTFSGRSPSFPVTVPRGGRKILFVVFRRNSGGPYQTTLNLRTNDPTNPSFNVNINIVGASTGGSGGSYGGTRGGHGGGTTTSGAHLMLIQYPPESPVSNGQTVYARSIPGVVAIHFLVRNGGTTNLTLDQFSASTRAVMNDPSQPVFSFTVMGF